MNKKDVVEYCIWAYENYRWTTLRVMDRKGEFTEIKVNDIAIKIGHGIICNHTNKEVRYEDIVNLNLI